MRVIFIIIGAQANSRFTVKNVSLKRDHGHEWVKQIKWLAHQYLVVCHLVYL